MEKRKVIIELKSTAGLSRGFEATFGDPEATLDNRLVPKLKSLQWDEDFPVCALPCNIDVDTEKYDEKNVYDTTAHSSFSMDLSDSTYIVRGTVDADKVKDLEAEVKANKNVVNVYADVQIESQLICPGSPPLGSASTVENLLKVPSLKKCGMTGKGVKVAIVDTGVNMAHLNSKGKNPVFDAANSWVPASSSVTPGSAPVGHGTMCAYDVCIAAPDCTILDIALLTTTRSGSTVMEGFLSDAILAYRHLLDVMAQVNRPGSNGSLVVNNSWGMFHPSWDFPVGHPGNYSDNPSHPFNQIVRTLERAGADILFAAGNCGADCPDGRCQGVTSNAIYGANSSPYVTCVAGVDTDKNRVGYSSIGPGRLENKKPDISGYTHFDGSGVYAADGGTSAACPVVAGVVAAIRSKRPLNLADPTTRPSAIRSLLTSTAFDLGPTGYDYEHGYGVVATESILKKLCGPTGHPLCKKYPWICVILCRRYPWLCKRLKGMGDEAFASNITLDPSVNPVDAVLKELESSSEIDDFEAAFLLGMAMQDEAGNAGNTGITESSPSKKGDCGCNK